MDRSYSDLLRENEVLLKRLRHLLESQIIREYDAVDPRTKQYVKDIYELDRRVTEEPRRCPVPNAQCQYLKSGLCKCGTPLFTEIRINGKITRMLCEYDERY